MIKALFEGQAFSPDGKDESPQTMHARCTECTRERKASAVI